MMVHWLHLEGFAPVTAPTGREALALLNQGFRASVILLDLMMPVMDGWTFRRLQRSDPALADIPVVVLSAVDPALAGDLGAAAIFRKPIDFEQVIARVRQLSAAV